VEVGGLARSDVGGGFDTEFAELARDLRSVHDGQDVGAGSGAPANDSPLTSEKTE
jgi:hypothetical protein